ncbi:tyrosine-type recombinase/integrase [Catellatospora sp. KI3]|uniref:tyrosine-type recombinase/integrase n=1 Tax=Catellatospora sp. KI3 TaxID=3041620 RepID=UPI002482765E|nr:tyrosine-type recombinase/integrase [Catellatospora sp. KI3]MDI1463695.1 tyrosine-type recombinase/integrase [Catellatospora sp. KI3]
MVVPRQTAALAASVQEYVDFTEAWLNNRRLSDNTREAYRRDVAAYLGWCGEQGVEPLRAMFTHVNDYARALEGTVDPRSGRTLAPTTVARKMSGLSSWYDFLVKLGVVPANPVHGADRPQVSRDHSATIGMSPAEVDALLRAAEADSARSFALITLLADLGLRVGEAVRLDLSDLGHERGHRTVRFSGKGGKPRRRALAPGTSAALDGYVRQRADAAGVTPEELSGPVFVTRHGRPLDRHAVFLLVRRLAEQAGIPSAAQLSPHSLRHAFATTARSEGVPLEDVQDAMGHADPRTTRRYDRDRHNLDRDPSYAIWAARARRGTGR